MLRLTVRVVASTFAAFFVLGGTAAADPVQITSGVLTVTGVQDVMARGFLRSISYELFFDGFSLSGSEGDGPPQDVFSPRLITPSLLTPSSGDELVAVQTDWLITSTPSTSPTPFVLSGTLVILDRLSDATLLSDTVGGSGTATWQFVTTPGRGSLVSGVRYQFGEAAPVPEPATLWLLGSGLAGIAARRRWSRPVP